MPRHEQRSFELNEEIAEIFRFFRDSCKDPALEASFLKAIAAGEEGATKDSVALRATDESENHGRNNLQKTVGRRYSDFLLDALKQEHTFTEIFNKTPSASILAYEILTRLADRILFTASSPANQMEKATQWLTVHRNFMKKLSEHPSLLHKKSSSLFLKSSDDHTLSSFAQALFFGDGQHWPRRLSDALSAYTVCKKNEVASQELIQYLHDQLGIIDAYLYIFLSAGKKRTSFRESYIWLSILEEEVTGIQKATYPPEISLMARVFINDAKSKSTGPDFDCHVDAILQKQAKSPHQEKIRALYALKKDTLLLQADWSIIDALIRMSDYSTPVINLPVLADTLRSYDARCQATLQLPAEWLKRECASGLAYQAIEFPLHMVETIFALFIDSPFLVSLRKGDSFDHFGMNVGMMTNINHKEFLHPLFITASEQASERARREESRPDHFSLFKKGINGAALGQITALGLRSPALAFAAMASLPQDNDSNADVADSLASAGGAGASASSASPMAGHSRRT